MDVPVPPAAVATLVAASVKLFVPVDPPLHSVSKLLKFTEPSPAAKS